MGNTGKYTLSSPKFLFLVYKESILKMILLSLYIIVIVLDFVLPHCKWLTAINFTLMWILMGWNYGNADYFNYLNRYDQEIVARKEYLYSFLQLVGSRVGISYQGFLIIMSFCFLLIRFISIIKMSKRANLVFGLYLIFPFIMDTVQLRQFYAISLVLLGISFLFTSKRLSQMKYICCVICAFFIQNSCAYYLILLIPYWFRKKWIEQKSGLPFIGITAGLYGLIAAGFLQGYWGNIIQFLNQNEWGGELGVTESSLFVGRGLFIEYDWKTLVFYSAEVLLMFMLTVFVNRHAILYSKEMQYDLIESQYIYINWCAIVTWILLPVMPLLALNKEMYRLQHGFLIPIYIMISNLHSFERDPLKVERNVALSYAGVTIMALAFMFLFEMGTPSLREYVFDAAFQNNLLFSTLR